MKKIIIKAKEGLTAYQEAEKIDKNVRLIDAKKGDLENVYTFAVGMSHAEYLKYKGIKLKKSIE